MHILAILDRFFLYNCIWNACWVLTMYLLARLNSYCNLSLHECSDCIPPYTYRARMSEVSLVLKSVTILISALKDAQKSSSAKGTYTSSLAVLVHLEWTGNVFLLKHIKILTNTIRISVVLNSGSTVLSVSVYSGLDVLQPSCTIQCNRLRE